jgi:DNA replication and repair protein RecF
MPYTIYLTEKLFQSASGSKILRRRIFVIDAEFRKNERNEQRKKGQKKILKRNGNYTDHIGFIPLVIISPADRDLIVEGSETRRKFMDSVISTDSHYLQTHSISKVMSQRNALLKYFALNHVLIPIHSHI